jgi:hypothetical protein
MVRFGRQDDENFPIGDDTTRNPDFERSSGQIEASPTTYYFCHASVRESPVLNRLAGQAKSRKYLVAGMIATALMICLLSIRYRRYAYAVAWHCVHGNHAEIGGRQVSVPVLWWKERAHGHATSDFQDNNEWLERACPSSTFPRPEIEISPVIPGAVADTDREEYDLTRRVVSSLNEHSAKGCSHSLIVLPAAKFSLYCVRSNAALNEFYMLDQLSCNSTKLQYSFGYSGPSGREKEAEAIFLSLQ